ncbi:LADA_0H02036g1_1 [Lachancea dasiensis]|uniref:Post-GPI attachment to proteins factor 3 n=1 Tax=Lachancea dasiensis TaxID=1072105 RepID=A0A1G4JZJ8_9SACH|nr:LADA_0H02036g1_1 [Lachancea dasiensis]
MRLIIILASFLAVGNPVRGSIGDRLDEFQECKDDCQGSLGCNGLVDETVAKLGSKEDIYFSRAPSLLSNFAFWDCESNCDYQCQQIITQMRIFEGDDIVQFHGKWPFKRFLGVQEFFSTIFSMANFIPHYRGYQLVYQELKSLPPHKKAHSLLHNYIYVAIMGMLAWVSSTVFHFRDLEFTEKLDYFFAGATVLSGFHAILIRLARFDNHKGLRKLVSGIVALIFTAHVVRQYLDWSYTYNMRFNVAFGVLQYILLLTLSVQNYNNLKSGKLPRKAQYLSRNTMIYHLCVVPAALVIGTSLSMSCELFDFFSYRWQIDSHAIWHACTVLPSWKLYDFFIQDFRYMNACDGITVD